MPNTLEFQPGQDYYFISTSRPGDVKNRIGGFCSSHNMKVMFKVLASKKVTRADEGSALESKDQSSTGREDRAGGMVLTTTLCLIYLSL